MFSDKEREYLKSQRLARIATVSKHGQPDVAPVIFMLDGEKLVIPSIDMEKTLKYKNIRNGNALVAVVVDDVESARPFRPRGIKMHGTAKLVEREGPLGYGLNIVVTPLRVWSWGVHEKSFENGRPLLKVRDRAGGSESVIRLGK